MTNQEASPFAPISFAACPKLPDDFVTVLQEFTEIGSPTGQEGPRADYIMRWFEQILPGAACRDELHNVIVDLSGGASSVWLFDAHTDTVFDDTKLTVTKDGASWRCPGIIDDSLCCVMLLLLGRHFLRMGRPLPIIISFSVSEEGEGNLKGILRVGQTLQNRLRGAWALDGGIGRVTEAASGSKRWKLTWTGAGGHSWSHFGQPSAIHAMVEWSAKLPHLAAWKPFQLTYNLGKISGGSTVTSIAAQAGCSLDLRSTDPEMLAETSDKVVAEARRIAAQHKIELHAEMIGGRPASRVLADPPLLDWLKDIHADLGLPYELVINSTNANGLLSLNIPATSTGLAHGGQIHTRDEWLDLDSTQGGWKKLWAMAARVCMAMEKN